MHTLRYRLRPRAAFGGPLRGDTLFGQLCWAVRNRWGVGRLGELLQGYTEGQPFAVCSDAFPAGHLPRPALPAYRFRTPVDVDRKAIKRQRWLPLSALSTPVEDWLAQALDDASLARQCDAGNRAPGLVQQRPQPHNSIDRRSGTTGPGAFAPYTQSQYWYAPGTLLDVYLVHDPDRIDAAELQQLLSDIGQSGYGRDASIGLGKFDLDTAESVVWPAAPGANTHFTLAPCLPQGLGLDAGQACYQVFTRFGRHGDRGAHEPAGAFKTPVLLADTGALFGCATPAPHFGQGLGGQGQLSRSIPETVQQGYAPCVAVHVTWEAA